MKEEKYFTNRTDEGGRVWFLGNPHTMVDRFVVVFDLPTNVTSKYLYAICMNNLGYVFHDEIDPQWLADCITKAIHREIDHGYYAIKYDDLTTACKEAFARELNLIEHGDSKSPPQLKLYQGSTTDGYYRVWAEDTEHAREQIQDIVKSEEINTITRIDFCTTV